MKLVVKLLWKLPSPGWPPAPSNSPRMEIKLKHLQNALLSPVLLPCCQKLTLVIRDSERGDAHACGDLFVRLHDHTGVSGSDYMMAHHDVTPRGSFDVFPRGAILRGNQISESLVMFKPNCLSPIQEGAALSRLYTLHVDGRLRGEQVSSTTFIRFLHPPMPNLRRPQFHLQASPRLLEPAFAICHRFCRDKISLEIVEPLIPGNHFARQIYWREDVQRHHKIPSGNNKFQACEPTSLSMRSRRAFIRDIENRLIRTVDPVIVGDSYFFPFDE
jgi:hypothetical protein